MSISNKLTELNTIKQDIKVAIENKDVDLTGVTFAGYAEKIDEIQTQKEEQEVTVDGLIFSSGDVVVTPSTGKVMTKVTVVKDEDLIPENIVKDVDIFGVLGTAETGGGGATVVELTQAQYDALVVYDNNTYYLISDTHKIYKGTTLLYNLSTPKFLFYGGYKPSTVIKADLGNLSTLNTSVSYVDGEDLYGWYNIESIATDDMHIYVGGSNEGTSTVRKYLKSDLSYVSQTPDYGGVIQAIVIDDTYIYVGGNTTKRVRKYRKSNLTYVSQTPDFGGTISAIAIDDTHIYVGGSTIKTVRKYSKSSLSYVGETPSYGDNVYAIAIDDTHIYAGGYGTQTVRKYLKSNLSYISESDNYGDTIWSIAVDDTHVYAVGRYLTGTVRKYSKSSLSYVGESANYGGTINSIVIDDTHIYVGGNTTKTVRKYLKSNLSYISESDNYGGNIKSIAIG